METVRTTVLGYPRIGARRELKRATEDYWAGRIDAAARLSAEAMRLGSRDPRFLYHAGLIARADGDLPRARALLGRLLRQSPRFNPLEAPRAERALASLGGRRTATG